MKKITLGLAAAAFALSSPLASAATVPALSPAALLGTLPLAGPSLSTTVSSLPVLGPALSGQASPPGLTALGPTLVGLGDKGFVALAPVTNAVLGGLTTGGGKFNDATGLSASLTPLILLLINDGQQFLPNFPVLGPFFGGPTH
ncbi:MAG: hypothetical protein E6R07_04470 [Nevskiaceae bacterium]|nr:MAG: hypothetical protein E6R07_04470 [Nevskiaceae bacterium]